jgi:murein DD-endopeptidase MepM/ murein hydrolase activator NlpD
MQNITGRVLVVLFGALFPGYLSVAPAHGAGDAPPRGEKKSGVVSVSPVGGPLLPADGPDGPGITPLPLFQPLGPLTPSVQYRFPLKVSDWWHLQNYVDLDPNPVTILDWGCHGVTYDGHQGHDITLRSFVEMDEGRYVLAAAPGTVIRVEDGNFDRQTVTPNADAANDVIVQHSDGSLAFYWHFAKWSTMVYQGQSVLEGQPLGLVGSAGSSSGPHLHFETQQSGTFYEPSVGACHGGTSLWKTQLPNTWNNPVAVMDLGETNGPVDRVILESRPGNVTHFRQTGSTVTHYVWYELTDLHAGDTTEVIWREPDSTAHPSGLFGHATDAASWWESSLYDLPTSGSTGTWTVQLLVNGVQKGQLSFTYNTTAYAPPVATGRTVNVTKGIDKDTLNGSDADSEINGFSLVTNPTHGEVKLYGARSKYFSYVPESGYSGVDTWQFRVTDGQGQNSVNRTMTMNVSPVLENALRLEGEDDYVSVPASPSLDLTSFTLEAWVRRTTGSAGMQAIFDRRHPTLLDTYGYSLFITPDSRLMATIGTGSSFFQAISATLIPRDRWVHVAATYDASTLRVFVNDVLDGSTFSPSPSYAGVGELRIGGSFVTSTDPSKTTGDSFRGEIEEARIWNVARDATQLQQGATCAFFDNPVPASVQGLWRFQGNANDSSANANSGSRVAGASFLRTDSAFPLTCLVQNLDGDGTVDGLDNCPLDVNDGQADADADGIGDLCDLCPSNSLPSRVDSDGDGVGDRCDNCPFFGNTEQLDQDSDGAGNLCDPVPANPFIEVPSDQITMTLAHNAGTGITAVSWTAGVSAASYEVFRGSRAELELRLYGTCQNSRDGNTTDTAFDENETPSPGTVFYFLVVGVGTDGKRGLAGLDSDGRQRDLRAKDCL